VNSPKPWQNLMKLKNVTKQMGKCVGSKQSTPNIFNTYSYLEGYKSRLSRNWHFLLAFQFFCVNFLSLLLEFNGDAKKRLIYKIN